jgi:hypothetical protein
MSGPLAACAYDVYPSFPPPEPDTTRAEPPVGEPPAVLIEPASGYLGCALLGTPIARVFTVQVEGADILDVQATPGEVSSPSFSITTDPPAGIGSDQVLVTFAPVGASGVDYDGTTMPVLETASWLLEGIADELGELRAVQAVLQVTAFGRKESCTGLSVQMGWTTPGDPDLQDGLGADVDLHLRHLELGPAWCDQPYDACWLNPAPLWQEPGATPPVLTTDLRQGPGFEQILVERPAAEVVYRVGVHYWDDGALGSSEVSVSVSMWGEEVYKTQGTRTLVDGDLWEVADVSFSAGSATPLGLPNQPGFCCDGGGGCDAPKH